MEKRCMRWKSKSNLQSSNFHPHSYSDLLKSPLLCLNDHPQSPGSYYGLRCSEPSVPFNKFCQQLPIVFIPNFIWLLFCQKKMASSASFLDFSSLGWLLIKFRQIWKYCQLSSMWVTACITGFFLSPGINSKVIGKIVFFITETL